jgi:hypothetical protein
MLTVKTLNLVIGVSLSCACGSSAEDQKKDVRVAEPTLHIQGDCDNLYGPPCEDNCYQTFTDPQQLTDCTGLCLQWHNDCCSAAPLQCS